MPNVKIRIEKTSEEQEERERGEKKKQSARTAAISAFTHLAISESKKIINNTVSHIGEWTGNYIVQSNISNALAVVDEMASFATAIGTSIAMQNPVPLIIKSISTGINYGVTFFNDYKQQQAYKRQSDYLLARSGNGTVNGSRGTEN